MLKIGNAALKRGEPRLAVSFSDAVTVDELHNYKAQGLDVAEIRVDLFASVEGVHINQVVDRFRLAGLPTILTIRSRIEGGNWQADEAERLALFRQLAGRVDAVDMELSLLQGQHSALAEAVAGQVKQGGKVLIVSHHNFNSTPPLAELQNIKADAKNAGADIIKIASQIDTNADLAVLTELLINQHDDDKLIVIGMGEFGLLSRLSFAAYGSLLTFACVEGKPTAPGQLCFADMMAWLRSYYPAYKQRKSAL